MLGIWLWCVVVFGILLRSGLAIYAIVCAEFDIFIHITSGELIKINICATLVVKYPIYWLMNPPDFTEVVKLTIQSNKRTLSRADFQNWIRSVLINIERTIDNLTAALTFLFVFYLGSKKSILCNQQQQNDRLIPPQWDITQCKWGPQWYKHGIVFRMSVADSLSGQSVPDQSGTFR